MKKDLCISPRNGRAKIISDKLVTCICDVVKKTTLKRLESCIIFGLKCKNCFAWSLAHVSSIRTMCAKIIDIRGAGKIGYCLKLVLGGQIRMKMIGSLT